MHFNINLIKDKVMPPEKRKKIFLSILAYLFICILIFVFLIITIGKGFMRLNNFKNEVLSLEKRLNQDQAQKNISEYNEELRIKIAGYLDRLNAIDEVLSKTLDATQLLQGISKSLPKGNYIDNISLDNEKKILSFNVVSPAGENDITINISDLITIWKKDKTLMSMIDQINSSQSQKEKKGQDLVLISQFSCTLSKEGL